MHSLAEFVFSVFAEFVLGVAEAFLHMSRKNFILRFEVYGEVLTQVLISGVFIILRFHSSSWRGLLWIWILNNRRLYWSLVLEQMKSILKYRFFIFWSQYLFISAAESDYLLQTFLRGEFGFGVSRPLIAFGWELTGPFAVLFQHRSDLVLRPNFLSFVLVFVVSDISRFLFRHIQFFFG